jgi:hypothetical protein
MESARVNTNFRTARERTRVPFSDKPMAELSLTLSPQNPADLAAIEKLDEHAFGPGRFARSAYRLRGPDYALSFVARARVPIVSTLRCFHANWITIR